MVEKVNLYIGVLLGSSMHIESVPFGTINAYYAGSAVAKCFVLGEER